MQRYSSVTTALSADIGPAYRHINSRAGSILPSSTTTVHRDERQLLNAVLQEANGGSGDRPAHASVDCLYVSAFQHGHAKLCSQCTARTLPEALHPRAQLEYLLNCTTKRGGIGMPHTAP